MPSVAGFESTPNPNAVKIVLGARLDAPPRSYRQPPEPSCDDALARALFEISGVEVVLIHHEFVTICKAADAKWPAIKRKAKAVIQACDEPVNAPADDK